MAANSRIGKGFDLLAPIYDGVVKLVFGDRLWKLQADILSYLPTSGNCLIIGGGSGKILEIALQQNLSSSYFYAELSDKMIDKTKARVKDSRQAIEFANDWKTWHIQSFDYIVLPFVLDCYNESSIIKLLSELSKSLSPKGKIIFIDFSESRKEHRPSVFKRLFIRVLYRFFHAFAKIEATKLAQFRRIFHESGFELEREKTIYNGWIQAIVWIKMSANE